MEATLLGEPDTVRFLLKNGADPAVQSFEGLTVLFWAQLRENARGRLGKARPTAGGTR